MAKKEIITIHGDQYPCLNINNTVGAKEGMNKKGDVMLIQAMFKYIAVNGGMMSLGIEPGEVPEVTGTFDPATERAIKIYQGINETRLVKTDGIIHPASYSNRNLTKVHRKLMTITLLHFDCILYANADGDYTIGTIRRFPQLLPWIQ